MAFMITCNNKGCYKTNEPKLDVASNEIYCSECDQIIANASPFIKNGMKGLGQVRKAVKHPFAVKCGACGVQALPKLGAGDQFLCTGCSKPVVVDKFRTTITRDAIKSGNEMK